MRSSKKGAFVQLDEMEPRPQARVSSDSVSKSHAALEVDNYFADVVSDDKINPLKYWKINSGRFPLLSKLAIEIYSCPATTTGIERIFSIAGHLIGTRATTMKDDNFEKLFCNVNQEAMFSGRKRKFMSV